MGQGFPLVLQKQHYKLQVSLPLFSRPSLQERSDQQKLRGLHQEPGDIQVHFRLAPELLRRGQGLHPGGVDAFLSAGVTGSQLVMGLVGKRPMERVAPACSRAHLPHLSQPIRSVSFLRGGFVELPPKPLLLESELLATFATKNSSGIILAAIGQDTERQGRRPTHVVSASEADGSDGCCGAVIPRAAASLVLRV